jgi:NADH:ubiquinone oxidoreductase subunit 4 (subunit M)
MTPQMTNSNINYKGCLFPKLWRGFLTFLINMIRVSIYICFLAIAQDLIGRAIAFSDRTGE